MTAHPSRSVRSGLAVILVIAVLTACRPASSGVNSAQANATEPAVSPPTATAAPDSTQAPPTEAPPTVAPAATAPTATSIAVSPAADQPTPKPAATSPSVSSPTAVPTPAPAAPTATTPQPVVLPASAHLDPMTHAYQSWNNCSAVSSSMVLSYFGITRSQEQLATVFRPNLGDKHVEPKQLVAFFPGYGLNARLVEGGSVERIKQLIAAGIPVITPQWLDHKPDAIGHYRVVRGYDDARGGFLVNDSMIGPDVFYSYDDFVWLWRAFNYRYIPVYRPADEPTVLAILGPDADRQINLLRTLDLFTQLAEKDPGDAYLRFSIGSNFYELGNAKEAVAAYERAARMGLPPKMLWYQFWPVMAYNDVGRYEDALKLATTQIATAGTFGEMRYERGRAYEALGNLQAAVADYHKAEEDDANLVGPHEALKRLGLE